MGEQARSRDALINNLRGYGCLDQRFAVVANPFATYMAFNGKYAGRVVQLFADVLADALEGTATLAVSVVRFVMDQRARGFRYVREEVEAARVVIQVDRAGRAREPRDWNPI